MKECATHHYACDCREALCARALEIADNAMTELLRVNTMRIDEYWITFALRDAGGNYIDDLSEAEPAIIEAVEWLQSRGLCEIVESKNGAVILLTLEIEEA